jgi:hypothetical protein
MGRRFRQVQLVTAAVGAWAAFALLPACPTPVEEPGEPIARFAFEATVGETGLWHCTDSGYPVTSLPASQFAFTAHFRGAGDGGIHWMVVGSFARDAGFDGQFVSSAHAAPRRFEQCGQEEGDNAIVEELLHVALLSRSQVDGGDCPLNPLTGGVPAPTPDGSIVAPGMTPSGFDALKACGVLVDTIVPNNPGACPSCTTVYQLNGTRL